MAELQADLVAGRDRILVSYRNEPGHEWKPLMTLDGVGALQLGRLLIVRAEILLGKMGPDFPVKAVVLKTGREI